MANIVGYKAVCFRFHGEMNEKFIVWILKNREPKSGKIVPYSERRQRIQKPINLVAAEIQCLRLTFEDFLVLRQNCIA